MRKMILAVMTALVTSCSTAQEAADIQLQSPDMNRGSSMMQALANRQSTRECADKQLTTADLSDLLWAANGINRSDEGKRTAPSALNKQDIDVYVITKDGAYKYDAAANVLRLITAGDHRGAVAGRQDFVKSFPVTLVMVSDLSKFGSATDDRTTLMAAMDAGYVSQNVCLFCAAAGLVTVPRASMDAEQLKKVLRLSDTQLPLLNNPVGYPK